MIDFNQFRKNCQSENIPIISSNTENFLINILENNKPKYTLEIWTAVWYSTSIIWYYAEKRNWLVYTFELWFTAYRKALKNFYKYKLYNITAYNLDFLKIPLKNYFPFTFDIIFIDWAKKHYKNFLEKSLNLVHKNSIIILDDVIKFKNKMTDLYNFVKTKKLNYQIKQLDEDDGIMIIKI